MTVKARYTENKCPLCDNGVKVSTPLVTLSLLSNADVRLVLPKPLFDKLQKAFNASIQVEYPPKEKTSKEVDSEVLKLLRALAKDPRYESHKTKNMLAFKNLRKAQIKAHFGVNMETLWLDSSYKSRRGWVNKQGLTKPTYNIGYEFGKVD